MWSWLLISHSKEVDMKKLFAGLFVAALMIGLGSAPTLTLAGAGEDTTEAAGSGADQAKDSKKDETLMEKLEDAFKETTTPTDKETDPVGTTEDADRDLY
jgi:TfoX/Sxy family transcriptional regulator of competence genes